MNKNKDNNIILTIIAIITLLIAIVGASVAYFSAISKTKGQIITTGELKISAVSGAVNEADIIPVKLENIPTISAKMLNPNIAKLPLTIDTTGTTIAGTYQMYLNTTGIDEKINTNLGNSSHIKWELVSVTGENQNTEYSIINSGDFKNGDAKELKISNNQEIFDIAVNGSVQKFNLLIYILDDGNLQDDLQSMTITASTTVEAKQK